MLLLAFRRRHSRLGGPQLRHPYRDIINPGPTVTKQFPESISMSSESLRHEPQNLARYIHMRSKTMQQLETYQS